MIRTCTRFGSVVGMFFFANTVLWFVFAPTNVIAQSAEVTGGSILCSDPAPGKTVNWAGTFEDVGDSLIVGCYAPVYYGEGSPATYYSPGSRWDQLPPTDDPGACDGSPTVEHLPINGPGGGTLLGVYVWFEYGYWYNPYNSPYWFWESYGVLCGWYWIPNPGGSCFAAGTHLLTAEGSKPIEQLMAGDRILTSPRDNTTLAPAARRIKQVFSSREKLFDIVVGGQTIHTTREHPVYTKDKGWIPAASLAVGDLLRSDNDRWVRVESTADGVESMVYNIVVDGKSGYFVGRRDWGFSMWVSDACSKLDPPTELLQKLISVHAERRE